MTCTDTTGPRPCWRRSKWGGILRLGCAGWQMALILAQSRVNWELFGCLINSALPIYALSKRWG